MAIPARREETKREKERKIKMNVVALSGRLTKDAEIKLVGQDKDLQQARFTLAVDDYKGTDFISCRALGKQAEFIEKWTKKGTKVEISGKIKTGNYENANGQTVYYTEVQANSVSFGESKAEAESRQKAQPEERKEQTYTECDGFMNIPDGIDKELPFN